MWREYYDLMKPGIVYGNAFAAIAAYFFATRWVIDTQTFSAMIIGIVLVIASAAILNNYFDRELDKAMERTRNRALATGTIPAVAALGIAFVFGLIGFGSLFYLVNPLTAYLAFVGFFVYVAVYGVSKRATPWGVLVGAIAGAMPILVGYSSAGHFDFGAFLLFLILFIWQMPHFWSIAIYRFDEYAKAGIPALPIQKGVAATKYYIVSFIIAFSIFVFSLTFYGYAGYFFATAMAVVCAIWLLNAVRGFKTTDDKKWARRLYFISLIVMFSFAFLLSIASIIA